MALRSRPSYYGHPQSAFSETIEGIESASSIIQKIHRGPQWGNEVDYFFSLLFMYPWSASQ